jgi:hypothetical protein
MRAVPPLSTASASKVHTPNTMWKLAANMLHSVFLCVVIEIMASLIAEASMYWRSVIPGFHK